MIILLKKLQPYFLLFLLAILLSGCGRSDIKEKSLENAQKSIKLGVITDIHKCKGRIPTEVHEQALAGFIKEVNSEETDYNFNLGDNISYRVGRCPSEENPRELEWVLERIRTESPMKFILSDHDINDRPTFDFWKEKTTTPESYYSLDSGEFHIIVLDTITGDGEVLYKCERDEKCSKCSQSYREIKKILKDEDELKKYLDETGEDKMTLENKKDEFKKCFEGREAIIKKSRRKSKWNKGIIEQKQLDWLKNDIATTQSQKIIVFSDHPLFYFQKEDGKVYDIENRLQVQEILRSSGKQVVSISGEAHVWHEEVIDGVQYYIVKSFIDPETGSWALFEWDESGYRLIKMPK